MNTAEKQQPEKKDLLFLAQGWRPLLSAEFSKPYMDDLRQYLKTELKNGHRFFPDKDKIFRALKQVDYKDVRVVILGQDPYHGRGQANGLAFAVEEGVPPPPSLLNIFKEIEDDIGATTDKNDLSCRPGTTLEGLARQGVLLLNTVLTVRENCAFSHRQKGWEILTDKVIALLNEHPDPIVFLLWGAAAQGKKQMITEGRHAVFTAPHPSPLSAHRGFLGCRHFSKANAQLVKFGFPPIDWKKT